MTVSGSAVCGRAGFSRCGRNRYWLRRCWNSDLPQCTFIGLNPSTADAHTNDPTLRRCINFADQWGYGSLLLVNLFALRSTDPRALRLSDDPQGPRANEWLRRASRESTLVIAAWGNGGHLLDRANRALPWVENPHCLGLTASGMPKHPLYCPKTSQPRAWCRPPHWS